MEYKKTTFLDDIPINIPDKTIFDKESFEVKEKIKKYLINNQNINIYQILIECIIFYCSFNTIKKGMRLYYDKVTLDCWHLIAITNKQVDVPDYHKIINYLIPHINFLNINYLDDISPSNNVMVSCLSNCCFEKYNGQYKILIFDLLEKGNFSDNFKDNLIRWLFNDCVTYQKPDLYIRLLDYGNPDNFLSDISFLSKKLKKKIIYKFFQKFLLSLQQKQNNLKIINKSSFFKELPLEILQNIYLYI